MNTPKPGAYRAIFKKAIERYLDVDGGKMSPEDYQACHHYLKLLNDPDYKFGKQTGGSYAPGELFFRT